LIDLFGKKFLENTYRRTKTIMWELNLEIEVLFQEGFGELKNSFGVAKVKLAI